jgi:hypothetical protein
MEHGFAEINNREQRHEGHDESRGLTGAARPAASFIMYDGIDTALPEVSLMRLLRCFEE